MNVKSKDERMEIVTVDFIHLNRVLTKMVGLKCISVEEKESILNKAGLLKLSETEWIEEDGSILTFN
jgi:hypothetical protein